MNRMKPRPSQTSAKGHTDLLLRLFDSQFFDASLALTYIYQRETSPGVLDYLCNKLYELPEHDLERYLSQFCQLIAQKPGGSLERVVVDLCSKSLRIAVKVFWLFKAISQEPKCKHAADILDKCEKAALNGSWEFPFKDPTLQPLSPTLGDMSPSDDLLPQTATSVSPGKNSQEESEGFQGSGGMPPCGVLSSFPDAQGAFSPADNSPSLCSSSSYMGQGLEGLLGSANAFLKSLQSEGFDLDGGGSQELSVDADFSSSANFERCRTLRQELGEGEGVSALLEKSSKLVAECGSGRVVATEDEVLDEPLSSPRLRQTTFGSTLDFIDALCDASSGLMHIAQEARLKALCRRLSDINNEIDYCSRNSVAIYFPLSKKTERIVRIIPNEVTLLNSREKAPFLLLIEVLQTDKDSERSETDIEADGASSDQYADSAHSLNARCRSHVQAGFGPGSCLPHECLNSRGCDDVDTPDSSAMNGIPWPSMVRSLSESSAWKEGSGSPGSALSNKGSLDDHASVSRINCGQSSATELTAATPKSSFTRRLDRAMTSLRGDGPLIQVKISALEHADDALKVAARHNSTDSEEQWTTLGDAAGKVVNSAPAGLLSSSRTMALLSRFGLCRTACLDFGFNEEWSEPEKEEQKLVSVSLEVVGGLNLRIPCPPKRNRRVPSYEAIELVADKCKVDSIPSPSLSIPHLAFNSFDTQSWSEGSVCNGELTVEDKAALKRQKKAKEVYRQRWADKMESVRRQSPHGRRKGWQLRSVIVKSGDDCRQELLAVQLIRIFEDIFREAKLPLWLRPYDVLVTSNRTALIEFIPDTLSIHSIKQRSRPGTTLSQHFFDKFRKGTPECAVAQRNFVESMAAYSLVCYLLQMKDRHNSNLLLDDEGHIVHIDFGFMLSNSPGGVNFESAPFKLTRELLEVMDSNSEGRASEPFDYFKVLCIKGFLACRKHWDRIYLLCEMMSKSNFPCFKAGDRALKALKKRFHLHNPEEQCVQLVLGLISDSLDAWRTRQYDYYQRVLNGIL